MVETVEVTVTVLVWYESIVIDSIITDDNNKRNTDKSKNWLGVYFMMEYITSHS